MSDNIRYEADYRLATDINDRIKLVLSEAGEENLPVYIIGKYDFDYGSGFLRGDFIGKSAMNHWAMQFINAVGYKYSSFEGNSEQTELLRNYAKEEMKAYPDKSCTKIKDGVVIIKLSE